MSHAGVDVSGNCGVDSQIIPLVEGWRAQRVPDTSGQAGVVSFSD